MPEQYIYESPKSGHQRSAPVDEDDTARRRILEGAGWRIVETVPDEGGGAAPVEEPVKPTRKQGKKPAEEAVQDSTQDAAEQPDEDES